MRLIVLATVSRIEGMCKAIEESSCEEVRSVWSDVDS